MAKLYKTDGGDKKTSTPHAEKMQALGQLAGGIAHDFNNILAIIEGYTFMLKRRAKAGGDTTTEETTDKILAVTRRGSALTRRLLAAGKTKIIKEQSICDLTEAVIYHKILLYPLIGPDITLTLNLDKKLPLTVTGDRDIIWQILLNLIINARDAITKQRDKKQNREHNRNEDTNEKETIGTIEIKVEPVGPDHLPDKCDRNNSYAALIVSDNGCGIDPEIKPDIFTPFYTTKESGQGTGLGLSIVYGLMEQVGGQVAFESEPGTGTDFICYFPLKRSNILEISSSNHETGDLLGQIHRPIEVLLIEDEEQLREMIAEMLISFGSISVEQASDADAALVILDNKIDKIDLVISDIVMPGMNGVRFAELARTLRSDMPILLMTGYPLDSSHIDSLEIPADIPLIKKPFEPDTVKKMIHTLLQDKKER